MKKTLIILLLGTLISCAPSFDKIVPNEVDQFARQFIEDIQKQKIDDCLNSVAKNMQNSEGRIYISNVASKTKDIKLDSLEIISASSNTLMGDNPKINYSITYRQNIDYQAIQFAFNIFKENGNLTIIGFDAREIDPSVNEKHTFSFKGKSIINYIFLVLAVASVSFIIFTIIAIIRSPIKYKWLWIIGVLIAVAKFKLNWTSGDLDFQLLHFQLLGAGFTKSGIYAPWILSFSIPAFAIAFWVKKFQKQKDLSEIQKISDIISKQSLKEDNKGA